MNMLGIDFEDWYHPQLVEPFVPQNKKTPTMFKGLEYKSHIFSCRGTIRNKSRNS